MEKIVISEKGIKKFYAHRYALKVVPFLPITLLMLSPLFCFGLLRYKKAYVIPPILYVLSWGCWAFVFTKFISSDTFNDFVLFASISIVLFLIFGTVIASFICLVCIASRPDKMTVHIIKQTYIGEGKQAKQQLIKALVAKSKAKDYDGFSTELNAAHERYETRKDIILTKKEFFLRAEKLVVNCAIVDGKEQAKQLRNQCKQLYKDRDFETFALLFDGYAQKAEEYRLQLIGEQKSNQVQLEYDGKSAFDGKLSQRIGWTVLGNLVTFLTLGIAYPFALCWKMRWQINHTVYNGKRLHFDGTGGQLMGKWILWSLLTAVTFGIYGLWVGQKLEAWKAKHTHVAGEIAALGGTFDGKILPKFGWNFLCNLLSSVTLGIAYPFAVCIKEKWNKKHTVLDGRRLCFDGNGGQLMGKYIVWFLLSAVTFGIYAQFVYIKLLKWKSEHTSLSEEQECVL